MSPNGKMLAVGTEDNFVRLIDTSTWSETKKLTHRPGDPLAGTDWHPHEFLDVLNFSPDGTRLLSGTWDGGWAGSLRLWDVRTGAELLQYDGRAGGGRVAYSPDGKTISTLTPQSGPERWDAATGQRLSVEDLMDSHPDQDLADAAVSRWRAKTGVRGGDAWQAAVPPDRERVAVWVDGTFRVLDVATGTQLMTTVLPHEAEHIEFSPDGAHLAYDTSDGLNVIDANNGTAEVTPDATRDEPGGAVAISRDGKQLATAGKALRLWSLRSPGTVRVIGRGEGDHSIHAVALSPDGDRLAWLPSTGSDKIFLSDLTAGAQTLLRGEDDEVRSVAFSPDGRSLAGGGGQQVWLWDAATRVKKRRFLWQGASISLVSFSADGGKLGAVDGDHRTVQVWDVDSGDKILATPGSLFAFSPDARSIAVARAEAIVLVDLATGKESQPLTGYKGSVWSLAFSADGQVLASTSDDAIRFWDAAHSKEVRRIGPTGTLAFLPNHGPLVVATDGSISFWALDGSPLVSLIPMKTGNAGFAFTSSTTPRVAVIGPDDSEVRGAMRCRAGTLVFPFEMCRERFEVPGLLEKSLSPGGYVDEP